MDEIEIETRESVKTRVVVRLVTSAWMEKNGTVNIRKSLRPQRRLSCGNKDWIEEDAANSGAMDFISRVTNLDDCEDGLYVIKSCNVSTDYESGYVDDWDYELVAFDPNPGPATGGK